MSRRRLIRDDDDDDDDVEAAWSVIRGIRDAHALEQPAVRDGNLMPVFSIVVVGRVPRGWVFPVLFKM